MNIIFSKNKSLIRLFIILIFCISLCECNLRDRNNANFVSKSQWQDCVCDSNLKVNKLSVEEVAQFFYLSDILLKQNIIPERIFIAIAENQEKITLGGILIGHDNNISPIPQTVRLEWQEQEYLLALVNQPQYLFNRWQKLLLNDRTIFLAKRDSLQKDMNKNGNIVEIISDLRTKAAQSEYLNNNSSKSPISMHNFGLASDFAVIYENEITDDESHYYPLGKLSTKYGLTWGGNFVGFKDFGHIQFYKNGAEMLRKHQSLIFEFEPYRKYFDSRVNDMINLNKEDEVEDTKELLIELNKYKRGKACSYITTNIKPPIKLISKIKKKITTIGYEPNNDLLLFGDLKSKTISLITANKIITYSLGKWK